MINRTLCVALLTLALVTGPLGARAENFNTATTNQPSQGVVVETLSGGIAVPVDRAHPLPTASNTSKHVVSSLGTRAANVTAYGGTVASPQAICQNTSVTPCAPLTLAISSTLASNGIINRVLLVNDLNTVSALAVFSVYLYQSAPTLAGIFDASPYTPLLADIVSGAYLGTWICLAQVSNSDNSAYECSSTTQGGTQTFAVTDGLLRAVIVTPAAYVPANAGKFRVVVDAVVSAP